MIKIIQKTVIIGSLIVSGLYFIYVIGFSTPWANGSYGDFFIEAQRINHLLFPWAFRTLVFSLLGLIFQSHKNRHFYLLNYLFLGATVYCSIHAALLTLENVPPLKEVYLAFSPTTHRLALSRAGLRALFPTEMPVAEIIEKVAVIFDAGGRISYLLLVWAGLLVVLAVLKTVVRIITAVQRRRWEEENALWIANPR